jgi:hypothetical protein
MLILCFSTQTAPEGTRLWNLAAQSGNIINNTQTKLEAINNQEVDFSKTITLLNAVESKACVALTLIDILDSAIDVAGPGVGLIDMRLDDLANDFDQTWTILAAIETKSESLEDILISVESKLNNIDAEITVDFTGIFTALNAVLQESCSADSAIDTINSKLENLSIQTDLNGTFTIIDAINEKALTIHSIIDTPNCFPIEIKDSDITTSGFVINTPGNYILIDHITYNPDSTNTAAITIASNNVNLDLNGHTIDQGNSVAGTHGVEVSTNLSNIQIRNGTIRDIQDAGISINDGCSDLLISDVIIIASATANGIDVASNCKEITIQETLIGECQTDGITIASGCTEILIAECMCNENGQGGTGSGISIANAQVCFTNCITNNNNDDGISMSSNRNYTLKECKAFANGQHGFLCTNVQNSVFSQCIAKENSTDGIHLDNCESIQLIENISSRNRNNGLTLTGGARFCLIEGNYLLFNDNINIEEIAGSGGNSMLSNFTLNTTDAKNRTLATTSDTSFSSETQGAAFAGTTPSRWNNISMT